MADTIAPAAPVTANTVSLPRSHPPAVVAERHLAEAHRPAAAPGPADLDGAGVNEGLLDQRVGERRGLLAGGEVNCLRKQIGAVPVRMPW